MAQTPDADGPSRKKKLVQVSRSDPAIRDPLIGQTIGKCKIIKLLGEGRTAVVYRATYEPLKRTVALKVLQQEMKQHPGVVRVFQQEGRAVASIDHDNVVKIYDVGEDQGQHYLVLELLRGVDLRKLIDDAGEDGLPVDVALEYTRQAADGLAAAGRKNLIHRDIKPQNMVVEPDGTLKIVDFGLAAEAEGAFAGGRLGTPHYMPPEVCRGEQAQTASDVYSLGITLYHMLCGRPPYYGRKTTQEIVDDHLKGARLEPEKKRADLPRPVAELVRRMTRADPDARPSAADVATLIADRLSPDKLARAGELSGKRAGRPRKEGSKTVWIAAAAGGVVLIVLLAVLLGSGDDSATDDDGSGEASGAGGVSDAGAGAGIDDGSTVGDATTGAGAGAAPSKLTRDAEAELIAQFAAAEELAKAGDLTAAHQAYTQIQINAPAGSSFADRAAEAAEALRVEIEKDKTLQSSTRKKFISRHNNREAGEAFAAEREALLRRLALFEIAGVKEALEEFREKTRDESEERASIESTARLVECMESLLGIVKSRTASLPQNRSDWFQYDMTTDEILTIVGANEKGIEMRDDEDALLVKPWTDVPVPARLALLEQVRNPRSATETAWVAFYCQIAGTDRAGQYYDQALQLDDGDEIRRLVEQLKAG